jgi:hypothetical protein
MNHQILCTWLGLTTKDWPPDHYTLLGLKPDDVDLARIEQCVQERMARLRCYQLSHPEEATEGMNRLAQALICLSEAASKKSMKPAPPRNGMPPAVKGVGKETVVLRPTKATGDTAVIEQTKADWRSKPPPVRATPPPAAKTEPAAAIPPLPPAQAPGHASGIEELKALAYSTQARVGLGTLPALIDRIDQTRVLLTAWLRLGEYLQKRKDGTGLPRVLDTIRTVTEDYPPFIGHPGKPGYRVVALARLAMTFDMVQKMEQGQRDDLLRDWNAGCNVLLEHRRYLRRQFKSMRHHGNVRLALRAVRSFVNDHPLLFGAATVMLLATCVALRLLLF